MDFFKSHIIQILESRFQIYIYKKTIREFLFFRWFIRITSILIFSNIIALIVRNEVKNEALSSFFWAIRLICNVFYLLETILELYILGVITFYKDYLNVVQSISIVFGSFYKILHINLNFLDFCRCISLKVSLQLLFLKTSEFYFSFILLKVL